MTYCVALRLDRGLIFMSDTRTNAGIDNISKFQKMFTWEVPGERVITILTAGNLATTQAVISLLDERLKAPEERNPSIMAADTMFQVARLVGDTVKEVIRTQGDGGPESEAAFGATLIVGDRSPGWSRVCSWSIPKATSLRPATKRLSSRLARPNMADRSC